MQPLKTNIPEAEKFKRIRDVIEQYKQTGAYEHLGELAALIDYSRNTLYKIMAGTQNPPDILIYKFCEYYELKPAYFFGRSEVMQRVANQKIEYKDNQLTDLIELQKTSLQLSTITNRILHNIYEK